MNDTVPTPWQWQFPPCCKHVPKGHAARAVQLNAIANELYEAAAEASKTEDNGQLAYIAELMDVVHATETALREFPEEVLDEAKEYVIRKNDARNYYERSL